jgi:hypothetical protein
MLTIVTPFPEIPFIVFKRIVGAGPVIDWDTLATGTWTLNDDTDASMWYFPEYVGSGDYIKKQYNDVRLVSRAVTTEEVGSTLYMGGTVTSGQVPANMNFAAWVDGIIKSPAVGQVRWKLPALGMDKLFEFDSLAKQRDLRLGDYNVSRMSTSTGAPDLVSTLMEGELSTCLDNETDVNNVAWFTSSHHVCYGDSFNVGLIYCEAIAPEQNIRLKTQGFIEGTPYLQGPYAALATPSPPSDPAAIKLVADVTNQLPHSYPASYNDLGGLLGAIGHVIHGVSGVVSHLPIPGVAGIASVIHGISGHILNL